MATQIKNGNRATYKNPVNRGTSPALTGFHATLLQTINAGTTTTKKTAIWCSAHAGKNGTPMSTIGNIQAQMKRRQ